MKLNSIIFLIALSFCFISCTSGKNICELLAEENRIDPIAEIATRTMNIDIRTVGHTVPLKKKGSPDCIRDLCVGASNENNQRCLSCHVSDDVVYYTSKVDISKVAVDYDYETPNPCTWGYTKQCKYCHEPEPSPPNEVNPEIDQPPTPPQEELGKAVSFIGCLLGFVDGCDDCHVDRPQQTLALPNMVDCFMGRGNRCKECHDAPNEPLTLCSCRPAHNCDGYTTKCGDCPHEPRNATDAGPCTGRCRYCHNPIRHIDKHVVPASYFNPANTPCTCHPRIEPTSSQMATLSSFDPRDMTGCQACHDWIVINRIATNSLCTNESHQIFSNTC